MSKEEVLSMLVDQLRKITTTAAYIPGHSSECECSVCWELANIQDSLNILDRSIKGIDDAIV